MIRVLIDSEGNFGGAKVVSAERFAAVEAQAAAVRDRRLNACETCDCARCVETRTLPAVLRILAAAERRKMS